MRITKLVASVLSTISESNGAAPRLMLDFMRMTVDSTCIVNSLSFEDAQQMENCDPMIMRNSRTHPVQIQHNFITVHANRFYFRRMKYGVITVIVITKHK